MLERINQLRYPSHFNLIHNEVDILRVFTSRFVKVILKASFYILFKFQFFSCLDLKTKIKIFFIEFI